MSTDLPEALPEGCVHQRVSFRAEVTLSDSLDAGDALMRQLHQLMVELDASFFTINQTLNMEDELSQTVYVRGRIDPVQSLPENAEVIEKLRQFLVSHSMDHTIDIEATNIAAKELLPFADQQETVIPATEHAEPESS